MLEKFGGAVSGILCVLLAFSSVALADELRVENLTGLTKSSVQSVVAAASTSTKFEGQSSESRTDGVVSPSDMLRRPGAEPSSVEGAAEVSVQLSQKGGVKVTGPAQKRTEDIPMLGLGLSYRHTFGSLDTRHKRGNTEVNGEEIDISTPSLAGDARLYLSALGNFANLGNLPNLGNLGNLGPSRCYLGLQGALGLDRGNRGLKADLEPTTPDGRPDITLRREFKGSLMPYVGCSIFRFPNQNGSLNLQAGPRISFLEWLLEIDERPGGGDFHQIKKSQTVVGPAVGLEYNLELLHPGNLMGMRGGLQLGAWGEYIPGTRVSTRTQFFEHRAEADGGWLGTVRLGVFTEWR
jgi:hypothetical protein